MRCVVWLLAIASPHVSCSKRHQPYRYVYLRIARVITTVETPRGGSTQAIHASKPRFTKIPYLFSVLPQQSYVLRNHRPRPLRQPSPNCLLQ
ncbi:hypothetical protein B0T10DRAFT_468682 [Thelonectria olida]|uniref:Secreted protein n=1 Tax=Thelonectria olida TaxID=1576542 RepID=A0A9P8WJR5_9HYPO|nr:hypothetical protein B0T10DRAFT_468682 [Thelonectria olida]